MRQAAPLRADIVLKHGERPIAVVEAKRSSRDVRTGVQQARRYAERLDVPLAYATNGERIVEIDMRGQAEREVGLFRSPDDTWAHYRDAQSRAPACSTWQTGTSWLPSRCGTGSAPGSATSRWSASAHADTAGAEQQCE